jgi:uncharacterized protein (DUF1501 family)
MNTAPLTPIDRRSVLAGGAAAFGGLFLSPRGLPGLSLSGPLAASSGDETPKTLVLLQLTGGNDGLSMVVPHGDDAYYKNRPTIAIDKKSVLGIDRYRGLHPALRRLKSVYDDGRLAIVEGCGYPNPVRSHFKSMDIWHAASERGRFVGEGWIAKLSKAAWPSETTIELVVHIGSSAPYSVYSATRPAVAFGSAEVYKWFAIKQSDLEAYRRAGRSGEPEKEPEEEKKGGSGVLDRLRGVLSEAQESSQRVRHAAMSYAPKIAYPNNLVGNSLRAAAALIQARMGTRVLSVELGGFDSHNGQRNQHDARMRELDEALGVFLQDIHGTPAGKNVIVVAFSEFGRRVEENASGGTDHGVAGPMLVAGSAVKGGIYGKHPSLTDLDEGDLNHTIDFRSVYGTVVEKWFGADQAQVFDKRYTPLAFV